MDESALLLERPRRLGAVALLAMSVAGFGIALYLTSVHYASVPLVCTIGGGIDCAAVTQSAWSVIPGTSIPVTFPGMLWFVVSGVLAGRSLLDASRGRLEPRWLRPAHTLWGVGGLLVVLWLVFAELVLIHKICEWCTVVHVLVVLSLLVAIGRLQSGEAPETELAPELEEA